MLRFVERAPEDPPAEREDGSFAAPDPNRARTLFFLLADESFIPTLRKLLAGRENAPALRRSALQSLVWLKAELPGEELEPLLNDPSLCDDEGDDGGLDEVLRLFRTKEAQLLARDHLNQLAPEERARLLLKVEDGHHPYYGLADQVVPELVDWLYDRWLSEDQHRLEGIQDEEGPLNLQVAVETRQRAKSRPLVIDHWRRAGSETRAKLLDRLRHNWGLEERNRARRRAEWWEKQRQEAIDDEEMRANCAASDPMVYRALAEALDLPHEHLIRYFGTEPLLRRIEQMIREASRTLRAAPSSFAAVRTSEFRRVFHVLLRWPGNEINPHTTSLGLCPDVDSSIRHELRNVIWDRLWRDDPAQAMAVAQAEAAHSGSYYRAHSIFLWTRDAPEPQDREFLMWAVAQQDVECRYQAMGALERLGEGSDEWRQRLEALSEDPNIYVRLNALAALAKRGMESRHAEVVHQATSAADVRVRGEAIRLLGELDAERHLALLRHALLEDHETIEFDFIPAAEEAALALARLGTPEALTALTHAFLVAPGHLIVALHWYFELMDPPGAPNPDLCIYPVQSWRKARSWGWLYG